MTAQSLALPGLAGKIALVTGAGSGIGKATALVLGSQGSKVAVADIDPTAAAITVSAITDAGGLAIAVEVDVRDSAAVSAAVASVVAAFGSLDVVVNNAGVATVGPVTETTEADWDRIVDTNLKGYFLVAKNAIPHLIDRGQGVIVNVASDAGLVGFAGLVAYCASKGGVVQLTRALAVELGVRGIRVNAVAPTSTLHTGMVDGLLESAENGQALHDALARSHPLPRLGTAEEVADFIAFLVSDSASYITGAILPIDGGITAACPVAAF